MNTFFANTPTIDGWGDAPDIKQNGISGDLHVLYLQGHKVSKMTQQHQKHFHH
jgi:hypothetical protein